MQLFNNVVMFILVYYYRIFSKLLRSLFQGFPQTVLGGGGVCVEGIHPIK